jgi:hypothetical protein
MGSRILCSLAASDHAWDYRVLPSFVEASGNVNELVVCKVKGGNDK